MDINLLIVLKSVDGGTGTYLEGLLSLKKKHPDQNLSITVLALEKPAYRQINTESYIYFSNKKYIPKRYSFSISFFHNFMKEVIWFHKNIKELNPTIVIAQDSHVIILSELTRLIFALRYKTINAIHNNIFRVVEWRLPKQLRSLFTLFFGFILRKSNYVVSVSSKLAKDLQSAFKLPNLPQTISCVLPSRWAVLPPERKRNWGHVVVCVSRMDVQKDHETLLEAFALVLKKIPDAELWLMGDGPRRLKLQNLVDKLRINTRVSFIGWTQRPEKLLNKADLFVLSSHWEGFPLSLIEAMSYGLPVISTDCLYGPSEILGKKNQYGITVGAGDVHQMARSIMTLLGNPKSMEEYATLSRERAHFLMNNSSLEKYDELIEKCANL